MGTGTVTLTVTLTGTVTGTVSLTAAQAEKQGLCCQTLGGAGVGSRVEGRLQREP